MHVPNTLRAIGFAALWLLIINSGVLAETKQHWVNVTTKSAEYSGLLWVPGTIQDCNSLFHKYEPSQVLKIVDLKGPRCKLPDPGKLIPYGNFGGKVQSIQFIAIPALKGSTTKRDVDPLITAKLANSARDFHFQFRSQPNAIDVYDLKTGKALSPKQLREVLSRPDSTILPASSIP